jgi:hypothetical protein
MKQIGLYKRGALKPKMFALVDDEDYEFLNKFDWYYRVGNKTFYARTYIKGKTVEMHMLLCPTVYPIQVDHKNGNGIDNQKQNLRPATYSQQQANNVSRRKGSSQYRGVCWNTKEQKWVAQLILNGVKQFLGYYTSEKEAALVYNNAAIKHFGEFAKLNGVLPNG